MHARQLIVWRVYDAETKQHVDFKRRNTALEYLMDELLKEFPEYEAKEIFKKVEFYNTNGRFSITEIDVS